MKLGSGETGCVAEAGTVNLRDLHQPVESRFALEYAELLATRDIEFSQAPHLRRHHRHDRIAGGGITMGQRGTHSYKKKGSNISLPAELAAARWFTLVGR